METPNLIENLHAIAIESPVQKIINQLRHLITSGQVKPGDRLPSERQLAERFGVGRSYVREAIMKLELYGLLKTSPQSGTYVAGLSIKLMDSILSDLISFNKNDFAALIEARYHLELNMVKLACERRSEDDIAVMDSALTGYEQKVANGLSAVEEDMVFHLRIARATQNSFMESMMLFLLPDLVKKIAESKICGENRSGRAIIEHRNILDAIIAQAPEAAEVAMAAHLNEILEISRTEDFRLKA
jgi:GntR family transcriptional repressor for pyruvate dehydrogenase complex